MGHPQGSGRYPRKVYHFNAEPASKNHEASSDLAFAELDINIDRFLATFLLGLLEPYRYRSLIKGSYYKSYFRNIQIVDPLLQLIVLENDIQLCLRSINNSNIIILSLDSLLGTMRLAFL
jgi:hypothetical protein